jgi:hypothetical protein
MCTSCTAPTASDLDTDRAAVVKAYPASAEELASETAEILGSSQEVDRLVSPAIAECMAALGFEYEVWVAPKVPASDTPIVDSVENMLVGTAIRNPNDVYLESLEVSDPVLAAQWQRALYGDLGAPTFEALARGESVEVDGCEHTAARDVVGVEQQRRVARILVAGAELGDLVAADPQVAAAQRRFVECIDGPEVAQVLLAFEEAHGALVDRPLGESPGLAEAVAQAQQLERRVDGIRSACDDESGLADARRAASALHFEDVAATWLTNDGA